MLANASIHCDFVFLDSSVQRDDVSVGPAKVHDSGGAFARTLRGLDRRRPVAFWSVRLHAPYEVTS
jgi:hypothetical protein